MKVAKKSVTAVSVLLVVLCVALFAPSFAHANEVDATPDAPATTSTEEMLSIDTDMPDNPSSDDGITNPATDVSDEATSENTGIQSGKVEAGTSEDTQTNEESSVALPEAPESDEQIEQSNDGATDADSAEQASAAKDSDSVVEQSDSSSIAPQATQGYWIVNDLNNGYGLQRYWYESTGVCATNRLIDPTADGSGWWAFATEHGFVVRGRYVALDGTIYFADNDGRLANTGWVVTDAYGQGLQRYWIDEDKHGAVVGYSSDGWDHYTTSEGYVARGAYDTGHGMVYVADNDGRLPAATGWLVTGDYTGGWLQRYYIDPATHAARSGFFTVAGYGDCFGLGWVGYVLRGKAAWGDYILLANNDGKMETTNGWLITGDYTGGALQRYWLETCWGSSYKGAKIGYSPNGWDHYTTPAGYVVRGTYDTGYGMVYLADNDGRLPAANGMLVTGDYTGGVLQRYYIDSATHAARSGFFTVAGYGDCFGLGGVGYVLRGKTSWGNYVLLANNDGQMETTDGWLVTGAYDGGSLQRYWLETCWDNHYRGAKVGGIYPTGTISYGLPGVGYVMRNDYEYFDGHWYYANDAGSCENVDGKFTAVEAYIAWAVGLAYDDSHGYDQAYRWGERGDYDCSTMVISAVGYAGFNTGGASYTGNMIPGFTYNGWSWNGLDVSKLKRGDILLNVVHHTAIYLGNGMLVHASGNEWGGAVGGQPGDQTGQEICVRTFYDRPWDGYLRCW